MISIVVYHSALKSAWDAFNAQALNGTLLFYRDFMEYHAHRFTDHSLLFYQKKKLVALLPLHAEKEEVSSHRGLTFGGFIIAGHITTRLMRSLFEPLRIYLREQQFKTLLYRAPPYIYYRQPTHADLMVLYALGAQLSDRRVVSVLDLAAPPAYSLLRKRCFKKALNFNVTIRESDELEPFMTLVAATYARAGLSSPTHTPAELRYLKNLFPAQITLWAAYDNHNLVGGVLIFDHGPVLNLQYMATNPEGKQMHALDLLMDTIIHFYQPQKKYLNLGTSQDGSTNQVNESLLRNKESYGARAVMQDTYRLDL